MSIHAAREKAVGFFNVKSIAYIILELVNKVHRLVVGMGSYGVSEVGTLAGRRMNGAGLTPRSVTGSGAGRGGRIMGAEARVHNELVEVGWFVESDRGWFDEEILG